MVGIKIERKLNEQLIHTFCKSSVPSTPEKIISWLHIWQKRTAHFKNPESNSFTHGSMSAPSLHRELIFTDCLLLPSMQLSTDLPLFVKHTHLHTQSFITTSMLKSLIGTARRSKSSCKQIRNKTAFIPAYNVYSSTWKHRYTKNNTNDLVSVWVGSVLYFTGNPATCSHYDCILLRYQLIPWFSKAKSIPLYSRNKSLDLGRCSYYNIKYLCAYSFNQKNSLTNHEHNLVKTFM